MEGVGGGVWALEGGNYQQGDKRLRCIFDTNSCG